MKKQKKILDIGEVSKETGLPPSTLRYYEEKGLIRSLGRSGLRRQYSSKVLEQLQFIVLAQQGGFSLKEIAKMFGEDGRFRVDRQLVLTKADELDKVIKRQNAIKDLLNHVANCPAPSHFECPKFQRLLRLAGHSKNVKD
jgi:DNA-binding transcriptional MerR regulator